MITRDDITLRIAVIGAILGVANTYWLITASIIKLTIRPLPALKREGSILCLPRDPSELETLLKAGNEPEEVVITITNESRAAAYVTGIGFIDRHSRNRFYLVPPDLETGEKLVLSPKEPRNFPTIMTPKLRMSICNGLDEAFAETSGGRVCRGSNATWEFYVRWLKEADARRIGTR